MITFIFLNCNIYSINNNSTISFNYKYFFQLEIYLVLFKTTNCADFQLLTIKREYKMTTALRFKTFKIEDIRRKIKPET